MKNEKFRQLRELDMEITWGNWRLNKSTMAEVNEIWRLNLQLLLVLHKEYFQQRIPKVWISSINWPRIWGQEDRKALQKKRAKQHSFLYLEICTYSSQFIYRRVHHCTERSPTPKRWKSSSFLLSRQRPSFLNR